MTTTHGDKRFDDGDGGARIAFPADDEDSAVGELGRSGHQHSPRLRRVALGTALVLGAAGVFAAGASTGVGRSSATLASSTTAMLGMDLPASDVTALDTTAAGGTVSGVGSTTAGAGVLPASGMSSMSMTGDS